MSSLSISRKKAALKSRFNGQYATRFCGIGLHGMISQNHMGKGNNARRKEAKKPKKAKK